MIDPISFAWGAVFGCASAVIAALSISAWINRGRSHCPAQTGILSE